jgi:tetratricopeptide (TPR) repeat protein
MNLISRIASTRRAAPFGSILLLSLALWITNARAESFSDAFEKANKLYAEGQYEPAINTYSNLAQNGTVSASLYFNLGNACLKGGRLGLAVVYYQRALEISPRDPDIRANLQLARSRAYQGNPPKKGAPGSWTSWFSLNEWSILAALAWWSWLGVLVTHQLKPEMKTRLARLQRLLLMATLITVGGLGIRLYFDRFIDSALVVVKDAPVKYGPLDESRVFYTLQDGAEITVIDRQDQWVQIRDHQQRTGWVHSDQVMTVRSIATVMPAK